MKISPALIPHSRFHTGSWLQSVERPGWYYFKKKKADNAITNTSFADSVDAPLKELVQYLHKKGIKTTPSCSGHDMSERKFETVYANLEKDAQVITTEGLTMKDVETGEKICYKDKTYALPWNETTFLKELHDYQHKGVIGLRLGNRKTIRKNLLHLQLEGMRIKEEQGTVFIFTNEDKQQDINATWKKITEAVIAIVEKAGTRKPRR